MDIAAILTNKFIGSEWTLNGDNYEGLTWLSETKKPTLEELENLWEEVEGELQAQADAKVATRESALAKLAAIGLTPEEIASL
jgi:DNA-binding NarL/FixJ family response regulator